MAVLQILVGVDHTGYQNHRKALITRLPDD